jgi:hypothetical protein
MEVNMDQAEHFDAPVLESGPAEIYSCGTWGRSGQRVVVVERRRFLPEPIDLDLDPVHRTLYWTDRGDPPRTNTVNRATMDPATDNGEEPENLFTHLMEGIGLALDLKAVECSLATSAARSTAPSRWVKPEDIANC